MGRYVFKLPDVGEGTAEAELVGWHGKVGDTVTEDQIVADVMTDKATVEITSPVAGKVTALHGEPGQMLAVRGPLVEFEVEGAYSSVLSVSTAGVLSAVETHWAKAPAVVKNALESAKRFIKRRRAKNGVSFIVAYKHSKKRR